METLHFELPSAPLGAAAAPPCLCGVVGSGNLEVLLQPTAITAAAAHCAVTVRTSARGFASTWQAVLADFASRHAVGGTRIDINDLGATPAVVSLRLQQAWQDYAAAVRGDAP